MSFKFSVRPFLARLPNSESGFNARVFDPGFARDPKRYLAQAGGAALVMLAILIFTDSIADAALAAGLGSSVIVVFVHPSSRSASVRSIWGGHLLALAIGSLFSLLLFSQPAALLIEEIHVVHEVGLAASVGFLILAMAVTDTEHPPAAGTVLAMSFRPWSLDPVLVTIAAVVILAAFRVVLGRRLKDLV